MKQKGVYPYDYTDSFHRFSEKKLPNKDGFYSILKDEYISDTQYVHAIKVWNTFKLKNMRKYNDLCLKTGALQLADVFENFRKTYVQYCKPEPRHYFTSTGLSWDAMLKMTDIKLELTLCVQLIFSAHHLEPRRNFRKITKIYLSNL